MCSLTNYDLIDILDQSLWFLTPLEERDLLRVPDPRCNALYAYDLDPGDTGAVLREAMREVEQVRSKFADYKFNRVS